MGYLEKLIKHYTGIRTGIRTGTNISELISEYKDNYDKIDDQKMTIKSWATLKKLEKEAINELHNRIEEIEGKNEKILEKIKNCYKNYMDKKNEEKEKKKGKKSKKRKKKKKFKSKLI